MSSGAVARCVVVVVLLLGGNAFGASDPLLMRPTRGGRALEVDRVEDFVSLLGRDYRVLTPEETAAWKQRQREQQAVDATLTHEAEDRSIVVIMAVLLTVFVLGTFVLVYWIRNRSGLR